MNHTKYGQIIAQGKHAGTAWQDVQLANGSTMRVQALQGASLNDLVKCEYRWGGGGGVWVATERLNAGIQKTNAVNIMYCRWCNEAFCAHCDHRKCDYSPDCTASCGKNDADHECWIASKYDPHVGACPDHIGALNREMERDRRAA